MPHRTKSDHRLFRIVTRSASILYVFTFAYLTLTGHFTLENGYVLINGLWLFLFFGVVSTAFFVPSIAPFKMVRTVCLNEEILSMKGFMVHAFMVTIILIAPVALYPLLFVPNISENWKGRLWVIVFAEVPIISLLIMALLKGYLRTPTLTITSNNISVTANTLRSISGENIKRITVDNSIVFPSVTIETFDGKENPFADARVLSPFLPIGPLGLAHEMSKRIGVPLYDTLRDHPVM